MKIGSMIVSDIRFQFKYGFYFLYLIFSLLYIGLLYAFPQAWREKAALLMIYTDPAAMGLFFMGAIVLYEKGERVLDSLAVSPVRPWEYVVSKLISIAFISVFVGMAIGLSAGIISNPLLFIVAVFLLSCVCSAAGLIIASKIATLNQFILVTVPVEIMMNVPAVFWIVGVRNGWLMIHPGICMIKLCTDAGVWLFPLLILILWTVLLFCLACHSVTKMLKTLGGIKL